MLSEVIKKLSIGASIAFIALSTPEAANGFQIFNTREEWQAALSNPSTTFDFSGLAGNLVPTGTVLPNGLSVNYTQSIDGSPGFTGVATNTGLSFSRLPRPTGLDLNLGFPSPVEAFALDASAVPSGVVEIIIPGITPRFPPTVPFLGFFGFIADPGTPVSNVIINCLTRSCVGTGTINVSNISVSTQAVPEPSSTFALSGLISIGLLLKRQQRKQKFVK